MSPSSLESEDKAKGLCMICGSSTRTPSSPELIKDLRYSGMIQHFYTTLGMDVKPVDCAHFDLCTKCFRQLEHYQEIQETLIFFENYRDKMIIELYRASEKRKLESSIEVDWVHKEIKKKFHGNEARLKQREAQVKVTLDQYEFEVSEK